MDVQRQGGMLIDESTAIFETVCNRTKSDKKFLIKLYHTTLRYRQPKKRVTKHRNSLKYRFKNEPIYYYDEIERMDDIELAMLRNAQWYTKFMNKCRMTYALM